jgi:hypothetical protein
MATPVVLELNCTGSRLAYITKHHNLRFFDLGGNAATAVPGIEKKETWSVVWDVEKDDTVAIMEKYLPTLYTSYK